ncbi:MAG: helix-turn-helix domain-containing protein, partial [Caulobacteraceae bacterium]|nr:helix-turn-helix domain-containing protein [Caulobacteraceae bacterium]
MALDAGDFLFDHAAGGDALAALRPVAIVLDPAIGLGPALAAARGRLGLAVHDIAAATRIRPAHVAALERLDLPALPARAFVVGYLTAYARALGLAPAEVIERFNREAPAAEVGLRAPLGLRQKRRLGVAGAAAIGVMAALLAWNVARHAKAAPPRPASAPRLALVRHAPLEPARLGAPLPPPPEAAAPPTYVTPGLAAAPPPA